MAQNITLTESYLFNTYIHDKITREMLPSVPSKKDDMQIAHITAQALRYKRSCKQ
jgi:hypothetical protein